ncbi:HD domain-containing protein [candidate division KSB1 bacterium]|nr:HD domain-containing protein [candidate division KSB1 bacterium]
MIQRLINLVPEFNLIENAELLNKSVQCWQDAMETGGWDFDDLDRIPFTLLIPDTPVSFLTHTRAVTQIAVESAKIMQRHYAEQYTLDFDALVSGALLHDIGKLLEYRRVQNATVKSDSGKLLRHPFSGAGLAIKHGLPDKIVHIIAVHAKEGDSGYRCPEAIIVHHADFMNFEPLKRA